MSMKIRPWTPDENSTLVKLRSSGRTIEACAFELRRSTSDVRRHMIVLAALLTVPRHPIPTDWTEAENDRFLALWNAGESATNMAVRFGRTSRAIYSHAHDLRERWVDISRRHCWAIPELPEPEIPTPVPVAVAPLAPARGFAVYASGISDPWSDDAPIGAGR